MMLSFLQSVLVLAFSQMPESYSYLYSHSSFCFIPLTSMQIFCVSTKLLLLLNVCNTCLKKSKMVIHLLLFFLLRIAFIIWSFVPSCEYYKVFLVFPVSVMDAIWAIHLDYIKSVNCFRKIDPHPPTTLSHTSAIPSLILGHQTPIGPRNSCMYVLRGCVDLVLF